MRGGRRLAHSGQVDSCGWCEEFGVFLEVGFWGEGGEKGPHGFKGFGIR